VVRLLPQDEGFFDLFERAADNLHQAGKLLDGFLTDFSDVSNKAKQINHVEHAGDHLTREAIEKLNRTFLAPFDREEIHALVCRMDDVLDHIDEAVNRMVLYRVSAPTDDAKALGKVITASTGLIRELMALLRNLKQPQVVLNTCLQIQQLESEGDRIEQHGLAALFDHKLDAIEIIKWKDIYGDLEKATDACSDVANVVESIVIRHS
jgi:predicted phosphate transport protein (TIGR00153 family)